ncbi:MAG: hypothetical protein AAF599_12660, partial [Bacteroidota bacterium]
DIPVIAVTAFAMKGDEERIRAGGCEDYVAKEKPSIFYFITTLTINTQYLNFNTLIALSPS